MYHDPVLYQRLAMATLQDIYTEAEQARIDSRRRRRPSLVQGLIRGLSALLIAAGTWLGQVAQPDTPAVVWD